MTILYDESFQQSKDHLPDQSSNEVTSSFEDKMNLNDTQMTNELNNHAITPKSKQSNFEKCTAESSSNNQASLQPSSRVDLASAQRQAHLFSGVTDNQSKCHVEYEFHQGRHVVLNQSVKAGDLIFTDTPYAYVVMFDKRMDVCHHCMTTLDQSLVQSIGCCEDCQMVAWCSQQCRSQSIKHRHSIECGMLKRVELIVTEAQSIRLC